MPSPSAFKKAFKLQHVPHLLKIHIGHVCKQRFLEYRFPLTLEFEPSLSDSKIRAQLAHTTGEQIVYSNYGNPYKCTIGKWQVRNHVAKAEGVAIRSRDVPSLVHRERDAREELDVFPSLTEEQKHGYRFVKSHFATSRCAMCEETVVPVSRKTSTVVIGGTHI